MERRQEPLSEADYDKLKGVLHALAAMLARPRNTEKTSAVVETPEWFGGTGTGNQPDTELADFTGTRTQWRRGVRVGHGRSPFLTRI